jgi:hypothetical protein
MLALAVPPAAGASLSNHRSGRSVPAEQALALQAHADGFQSMLRHRRWFRLCLDTAGSEAFLTTAPAENRQPLRRPDRKR